MITRRNLLRVMLASIAPASVTPRAEAQARRRRIVVLWDGIPSARNTLHVDAFKTGLREPGYAEGRDYTIEERFPHNDSARIAAYAAELVTSKRLDLLRQIVPGMRRVGFLYNPDSRGDVVSFNRFESDCRKLELKPIPAAVRKSEERAEAARHTQGTN